jgi:heme exporter protein B
VFWRAVVGIAQKDIQAELRNRRLISSMGLFALMAVLVFYFTLESRRDVLKAVLPSIVWVIIVFAGTQGLSRSLAAERDSGSLDALLLAPIPRAALFYGKFLGTLLYALLVAVVVAAVASLLFNISLFVPALWLVIVLGTVGFAAVGTLLGCIAIYSDGRETTLPILILPVVLPIIISAVRASTDILNELPFQDWSVWIPSLISVDLIFLALAFVLFDFVVEE